MTHAPPVTWSELCPRWASRCPPQHRLWSCLWCTSQLTWVETDHSPVTEWPAGSPGHRSELSLSSQPPLTGEDSRVIQTKICSIHCCDKCIYMYLTIHLFSIPMEYVLGMLHSINWLMLSASVCFNLRAPDCWRASEWGQEHERAAEQGAPTFP